MDGSTTSPSTADDPAVRARARATLGHHVILRLEDDRTIALTPADRRTAARIVYEHGEPRAVLAFRLAGSHVHVLLSCDRHDAGHFARYVATALRRALRLGSPFAPSRIKPIADQAHLENTFWYVLRQEQRHGLSVDPTHDGSSLPELVGARVLFDRRRGGAKTRRVLGGPSTQLVSQLLPTVHRRKLIREIGGAALDATAPAIDFLASAGAAAFGLPDILTDRWDAAIARHAAAHAAKHLARPSAIADHLGLTARSVQRDLATPIPAGFVRAVTLQMRLQAWSVSRAA